MSKIIPLLLLRRPQKPSRRQRRRIRPWRWMQVSAAKKPRVSSDTDAPMEGSSLEEVSSGQPGSSSRPSKAEGSPMGEGSTRRPKPSTRQPKVEGSPWRGIYSAAWNGAYYTGGRGEGFAKEFGVIRTTTVLPEAYELLEEDPEADSTSGRLDPQPTNEELVDKVKAYDEVLFHQRSKEYRHYREGKLDLEATSPIRLLRAQKHGGPHGGFYHDHCRNDPIIAFKLWHMSYRMRNNDEFPPQHPCEKYRAHETDVFPCQGRSALLSCYQPPRGIHGDLVELSQGAVAFVANGSLALPSRQIQCIFEHCPIPSELCQASQKTNVPPSHLPSLGI